MNYLKKKLKERKKKLGRGKQSKKSFIEVQKIKNK